jgi:hypothetical protein
MDFSHDTAILRELAQEYAAICAKPVQNERRALWRSHNSLKKTRPMVLCLWWANIGELVEPFLKCQEDYYRNYERMLRTKLFQDYTGDDYVAEPWINVRATFAPGSDSWGLATQAIPSPERGGVWQNVPVLVELSDADKLVKPRHLIDEQATARDAARLHEAIGDILAVNVDRSPTIGNMSYLFGRWRGIEQWMADMYDHPEWLHKVMAFMRDTILEADAEAERLGHWKLSNHTEALPAYEESLEPPAVNSRSVLRKQLWGWFNAQELTSVSPVMHEEFMLQYQRPIMEHFAVTHYGCCEDLTRKIDILRKVSNLRRLAVTPWADLQKCVEQVKTDYIISWQPNPAEMGCCGFDAAKIRNIMRRTMEVAGECHMDVVLKDVQTVEGHPERLKDWVRIVRDVTDR